ncbi:MAG TPA: hypothetical protein VMJ65_30750, partial [Solirubrobacteraceae bacterium]|nr:hypothetical protein [Solirubrobacteraceae bacterium]
PSASPGTGIRIEERTGVRRNSVTASSSVSSGRRSSVRQLDGEDENGAGRGYGAGGGNGRASSKLGPVSNRPQTRLRV